MNTSYFAKSSMHRYAVSIAGKAPSFYSGRQYKKLAPPYPVFKKYKEDGDQEYFTKHYYKEILDKLDPAQVLKDLGPNAVILCYGTSDKFCHRHIVSKWLFDNVGVVITEI